VEDMRLLASTKITECPVVAVRRIVAVRIAGAVLRDTTTTLAHTTEDAAVMLR